MSVSTVITKFTESPNGNHQMQHSHSGLVTACYETWWPSDTEKGVGDGLSRMNVHCSFPWLWVQTEVCIKFCMDQGPFTSCMFDRTGWRSRTSRIKEARLTSFYCIANNSLYLCLLSHGSTITTPRSFWIEPYFPWICTSSREGGVCLFRVMPNY